MLYGDLPVIMIDAGRCVARMGTQAAHAHLHEIECVERLGLNSLMRALLS